MPGMLRGRRGARRISHELISLSRVLRLRQEYSNSLDSLSGNIDSTSRSEILRATPEHRAIPTISMVLHGRSVRRTILYDQHRRAYRHSALENFSSLYRLWALASIFPCFARQIWSTFPIRLPSTQARRDGDTIKISGVDIRRLSLLIARRKISSPSRKISIPMGRKIHSLIV